MATPIRLEPSDRVGALDAAVQEAIDGDRELRLAPGVHLTGGGHGRKFQVGPAGLRIRDAPSLLSRSTRPIVRRPDHPIDLERPDSIHGLSFVPGPPDPATMANACWQTVSTPDGDRFEYAVVVQGVIEISGIDLDPNLGEQGAQALDPEAARHPVMLGFAGRRYTVTSPSGAAGRVHVAFESVALDDIEIAHGRTTISFSEPSQDALTCLRSERS